MDTDDDKDLFRSAMSDAKPLKSEKLHRHAPKPAPKARFTRADEELVLHESLHGTDVIVESGDEVQFCRKGANNPVVKKLKQGKYKIDEELDLHGLTIPDARAAINEFFREAQLFHWRCVRIIHGKGKRSFQGVSVLRPKVTTWLFKNDLVFAFCTALPRDGGTGALYVLLTD